MAVVDEEQRWEPAKYKLAQLGSVPASFSSLIRKMRSDLQSPSKALSSSALFELNRLLKGPSLISPMVHAALEFYPERLVGVKNFQKAVIEIFSIEELCALIGSLYLTRQVKKRCAEDEWKFIAELLTTYSTLAGHLGNMIGPLSFERSLLAVTFPILGMALFQGSSAKEYALYRRQLKKQNRYYDTENELKLFGTSSREIGSLLAQSVALSAPLAAEFLAGPDPEPGKRPTTAIQALNIWINSLSKSGTAPKEAMDARWYPTNEQVKKIESMAAELEKGDSATSGWIVKEGEDLKAIIPLLAKSRQDTEEVSAVVEAEIGENVEPFSEEETPS